MDENITIETLKKPEFLGSAKKKLEDILDFGPDKEARDFAYDIEMILKENSNFSTSFSDLYNQYQDVIIKLKLAALAFLTDDEIVATLKDNFSIMLLSFPPITNDIVGKLRAYLVGIPVYEERNALKGRIMKILVESQEKITANNIKSEDGTEKSPTISNWIKNYLEASGGADEDSLKKIMYLTNAKSRMNLSDKEEEAIKMLISLYEFLKKSSLTPEGLDESILFDDDGVLKIMDHGQIEIIE